MSSRTAAEAIRHLVAIHLDRARDARRTPRWARGPRRRGRSRSRGRPGTPPPSRPTCTSRAPAPRRGMPASRATSKAIMMAMPEHRAHRLLHEQIEGGLHLRAHLHRARAQHAEPVGQPQHALLRAAARVGLHPHAGPEALALEIPRARRGAGHARGHQQHVDAGGRVDEVEGQAVAGAEGDRAARPEHRRDGRRRRRWGSPRRGGARTPRRRWPRSRSARPRSLRSRACSAYSSSPIADADLRAGVARG